MFDYYKNEMGNPPSGCQSCWKVVVRPRTVKELFAIRESQTAMDVPCKCGIETRPSVSGLYGAYFYTRSKEEGLKRYNQVRKEVNKVLGSDVIVLLKRGCTEFEHYFGPSDKWEITDRVEHWEKLITDGFEYTPWRPVYTDRMKEDIWKRWIEWAYAAGDPTYKQFTNGKPLYAPYITYH